MTKLNNARLTVMGKYRAVYDIELVDEKKEIWKGKPYIEPTQRETPSAMKATKHGFTFFSRHFDPANEWDVFYPEIEIVDETIIGIPFLLVPSEKLLFGYDPPTSEGIIIPTLNV